MWLQALDLKEDDAPALVNRSKCYVRLGETDKALQDVNVVLKTEEIDVRVRSIKTLSITSLY